MIFLAVVIAILVLLSFFIPEHIVQGTIRMATPLILAGIGGLFSQLAGVLNIALEGLMLFAAFFSTIAALYSGSYFLGVLIGMVAAVLLASLFASISLHLKANIFFAGLATNLFAVGFTILIQTMLFQEKGAISLDGLRKLAKIKIPLIDSIPVVGNLLSGFTVFIYISWGVAIIAYIVIYKTTLGLRIRSVGENADAFSSLGLKTNKYRFIAIMFSGITCGLAGSGLALSIMTFAPNMVNNSGWIGLVTIFLGGQHPAGVVAASLLFGGAEEVSYVLQMSSKYIPYHFIQILPYVVTIIAMVITAQLKKAKSKVVRLD
jgi:simple sugar transport system permease protein